MVQEEFINDITTALNNKLMDMKGEIKVENFGQDFSDQDSLALFHKLYDPLYSIILEKNREADIREIDQMLDYSSGINITNKVIIS